MIALFLGEKEGQLPDFATKGWSYGGWKMASGDEFEEHGLSLEERQRILKKYQTFLNLPKTRTEGSDESEKYLKEEAEYLRRLSCVVYAAAASAREGRAETALWAIRHMELLLLDRIHDINQLRRQKYATPLVGVSLARKIAPTSKEKKRPLIDDKTRERIVKMAKTEKQLKQGTKNSPKKKAKSNHSQVKGFRLNTQPSVRQDRQQGFSTKTPQSFQTRAVGDRKVQTGRR